MDKFDEMLARAKQIPMSQAELDAQRRSFAYGNAHIENSNVTWEMVDEAMAKAEQ